MFLYLNDNILLIKNNAAMCLHILFKNKLIKISQKNTNSKYTNLFLIDAIIIKCEQQCYKLQNNKKPNEFQYISIQQNYSKIQYQYKMNLLFSHQQYQKAQQEQQLHQIQLRDIYTSLGNPYELNVDIWIHFFQPILNAISFKHEEPYLIQCLYEMINRYEHDKVVLKYFYLIDKLIRKYRNFIPSIQNILVDLFTKVLCSFWQKAFFIQIQELKIMRKLWLKLISNNTLAMIRNRVFQIIKFDLETGFKKQTIDQIALYYKNYLQMNDLEIKRVLWTNTFPSKVESRPNSSFPKKPLTNENEKVAKRNRDYVIEQPQKPNKIYKNSQFFQNSSRVISNPNYNLLYLQQKPINSIDGRFYQKVQNPILNQFKELRMLGNHICLQCGNRFSQKKYYEMHLKDHFIENKKKYDMKNSKTLVMNVRSELLSLEAWKQKNQDESEKEKDYSIPVAQFDEQKQGAPICKFCEQMFIKKMNKELWIYSNCIFVKQNRSRQKAILMHKTCYDLVNTNPKDSQQSDLE